MPTPVLRVRVRVKVRARVAQPEIRDVALNGMHGVAYYGMQRHIMSHMPCIASHAMYIVSHAMHNLASHV